MIYLHISPLQIRLNFGIIESYQLSEAIKPLVDTLTYSGLVRVEAITQVSPL